MRACLPGWLEYLISDDVEQERQVEVEVWREIVSKHMSECDRSREELEREGHHLVCDVCWNRFYGHINLDEPERQRLHKLLERAYSVIDPEEHAELSKAIEAELIDCESCPEKKHL